MELAAVGASGEGKAGQGAGDDVRAQPAWATAYGWQLYALLFKNAVLMVRQRAVLVTLVAVPALLVCVFGAILKASAFETVDTTPPVLMTMGGGATSLVRCTVYDQFGGQFGKHLPMRGYPCLTIAYAPDSEDVEALMRKMAEQTGLSFESDFRGFADRDALAQYFTRPEKPVHAALVFNTTLSRPHTVVDSLGASTVEDAFPYELWYNATVTDKVLSRNSGLDPLAEKTTSISGNQVRTRGWSGYVLAVQHAVNTALVALRVDPEASVDMKLRAFPFVSGPGFVDSEGIIRTIPIEQWGSMFYVIGVMTCFITALKQVAQEKDDRILDALRMMGLYESCYWLSWALYFMVISLLSTGLVLAAGAAFQIPYFVRTDAGVLFRVFWVFFFSMYAFALAVSSVVPNTKVATMTGFLFFALAVVVQLFLCLDVFPVVQFLYNPAVVSPLALRLINLYPAIGFSKIDRQIVAITSTKLNSSGLSFFDHYSSKLAQSSGAQFGFVQSGQTGVSVASIKCRGDNLTATEFFLNNCLHSEAYASSRSVCPEEEQKQSPLRLLEQSRRGGCAVTTRCTMEWVNAKARNIDDLLSRGDGRLLAFNLDRYTGADPSCAPGMSVVRSVLQLQNARNELVNVSVGFCSWTAEGCREAGGLPTSVYSGGVLRSTNCQCAYSIESENESLNGMLLTSAVWIVLAWYLGQVVTFGHGRGEWPWFPLTPWFWFSGVKNPLSGFCGSAPRVRRDASEQDDDVLAEERAVAEGAAALGRECPVVLQQMVKDFGRLSKFRAVDGLTLSLRSGECFVMLGHNGAGKSTAINMLSGMTSLSGGECTIYGKSVRDSMASIRHEVGVCPQHDILWGDLTAREHLLFYGHFQGMSSAAVRAQGERLLKQVHLDGLKRPAGNYSGGMKRRLSMTIAALGDKRVVFLDEVRAPPDEGQAARCATTNSSRLPFSRRVVAPASPRRGWTRRTSGTCGT